MGINGENHSSMFLDSDELVNETTKYFHLAAHFNPAFKKTLMIGAAAYSFPMSFLKTYPDATIDVVEIDPALTEIAKKYFNMNIIVKVKDLKIGSKILYKNGKSKRRCCFKQK